MQTLEGNAMSCNYNVLRIMFCVASLANHTHTTLVVVRLECVSVFLMLLCLVVIAAHPVVVVITTGRKVGW